VTGPCDGSSSCPNIPPCSQLLTDPAGVLLDRARWPRHVCLPTAQESVHTWMRQRLPGIDWRALYPLPIDPIAVLADDARIDMTRLVPDPTHAVHSKGDVRAALLTALPVQPGNPLWLGMAIHVPLGSVPPLPRQDSPDAMREFMSATLVAWGAVWLLGTVTLMPGASSRLDDATYGPLVVSATGPAEAVASKTALKLVSNARRWWTRWMQGKRVGAGGRRTVLEAEPDWPARFWAAVDSWYDTHDDPPTQPELAAALYLSKDALLDRLKQFHLRWPPYPPSSPASE
jgi:hypothetical protein